MHENGCNTILQEEQEEELNHQIFMKFYFCLLEPKSMETHMNRSAHMNEDYFLIFYFKKFSGRESQQT